MTNKNEVKDENVDNENSDNIEAIKDETEKNVKESSKLIPKKREENAEDDVVPSKVEATSEEKGGVPSESESEDSNDEINSEDEDESIEEANSNEDEIDEGESVLDDELDLEDESELTEEKDLNEEELDNEENERMLDDDEEVLEIENDTLIEREYLSSLLEQKDRLVYYQVENIYKDEKKRLYRSRLNLKKDPPVLVIRDDEENEVRFYLTENLTDELSETLRQVKRAYYGFSGPSDINMPKGFFNKIKYYIKNNPLKVIGGIAILGFLIILSL